MWIGFEFFEGAGRYVRKRAKQRLGTKLPDNYSGFRSLQASTHRRFLCRPLVDSACRSRSSTMTGSCRPTSAGKLVLDDCSIPQGRQVGLWWRSPLRVSLLGRPPQ